MSPGGGGDISESPGVSPPRGGGFRKTRVARVDEPTGEGTDPSGVHGDIGNDGDHLLQGQQLPPVVLLLVEHSHLRGRGAKWSDSHMITTGEIPQSNGGVRRVASEYRMAGNSEVIRCYRRLWVK